MEAGVTVGWRRPATVESAIAGLLGRCSSRTVMRKNRADVAEELGDKDGGVALHFGTIDPLQWCRARARASGTCGARHASRSERRMWNEASRAFVCVDEIRYVRWEPYALGKRSNPRMLSTSVTWFRCP